MPCAIVSGVDHPGSNPVGPNGGFLFASSGHQCCTRGRPGCVTLIEKEIRTRIELMDFDYELFTRNIICYSYIASISCSLIIFYKLRELTA